MKCKEPGAQKARHIMRIGELSSTARRSNSPAQSINQRLPRACERRFPYIQLNTIYSSSHRALQPHGIKQKLLIFCSSARILTAPCSPTIDADPPARSACRFPLGTIRCATPQTGVKKPPEKRRLFATTVKTGNQRNISPLAALSSNSCGGLKRAP